MITSLILAVLLPLNEMAVVRQVAKEYNLNRDETALLIAIRKTENGSAGREFGVGAEIPNHPATRYRDGNKSFRIQCRWAAGTIKRRYNGNLHSFAKRYCPPNHKQWTYLVRHFMKKAYPELTKES